MPNFIEVCAGCGGLSTGLIQSGWSPLLLCEINKIPSPKKCFSSFLPQKRISG